MELKKAEQLAESLIIKHNIFNLGWRFEFDRSKVRFGCCFYGRRKITLSKYLTELNDEAEVKNTILHEIAHALVGPGHGHNHVWKQKALEIGCRPIRCYSIKNVTAPVGKYVAVCVGCEKEYYSHRKRKRSSSCSVCSGGSYNEKFKLNWVETNK